MTASDTLRFALPSGRILETLRPMFNDLGLLPELAPNSRQLIAPAEDFSFLSIVDVKPSDVPLYVQEGYTSIGICGPDVWEEMQANCKSTEVAIELPGNPLRFSLIGTEDQAVSFDNMLFNLDQGASQAFDIATKYTSLSRKCIEDLTLDGNARIALKLIELSGKVELGPLLMNKIAADLIETGGTLRANNLVEIRTLRQWDTYYVLVNKGAQDDPRIQQILQLFRDNLSDYSYDATAKRVTRTNGYKDEALEAPLIPPGPAHAGSWTLEAA